MSICHASPLFIWRSNSLKCLKRATERERDWMYLKMIEWKQWALYPTLLLLHNVLLIIFPKCIIDEVSEFGFSISQWNRTVVVHLQVTEMKQKFRLRHEGYWARGNWNHWMKFFFILSKESLEVRFIYLLEAQLRLHEFTSEHFFAIGP